MTVGLTQVSARNGYGSRWGEAFFMARTRVPRNAFPAVAGREAARTFSGDGGKLNGSGRVILLVQ